jgi:AraC-like DNA-binding protein
VAFFNSGVPYHSTHPYGGGDHGSELAIRPEIAAEILGRYDPRSRERPESPFFMSSGPCPSQAFLLQRVLSRSLAARDGIDDLEVEELAFMVADMIARATSTGSRPTISPDPCADTADRDQAEALRGLLSSRPGARHSLDRLAAAFGSSPFRLCRVFRAATGTTIHRYLTQLRLLRALDRLADGCQDLTGLAFDLGFSSHSHFTATFRKNLGVTPETVRALKSAADLVSLRGRLAGTPAAAGN